MSIEIIVNGMTCAHCEKAVHEALAAVTGVKEVRVDRAAGRAWVEGNPNKQTLLTAVVEEGYDAVLADPVA